MVLVDTNVWINHLKRPIPVLIELLERSRVLMHPMVLGELACGRIRGRAEYLQQWRRLPWLEAREHDVVVAWIESNTLAGSGIGFIDAHLLHAVVDRKGTRLWTFDRSLHSLAVRFGVVFQEGEA